jgi:hypothetical protein
MNTTIPPGDWLTVTEAMALVPDVTRRRIQALAKHARVKTTVVLGRLLIDRPSLLDWKRTRNPNGGRPKKEAVANRPQKKSAGSRKKTIRDANI